MSTACTLTSLPERDPAQVLRQVLQLCEPAALLRAIRDLKMDVDDPDAPADLAKDMAREFGAPVELGASASTELLALAVRLRDAASQGSIGKAQVERLCGEMTVEAKRLLDNLKRLACLVDEFHGVGRSTNLDLRKKVELKPYLSGVLLAMKPRLAPSHRFELDCPDELCVLTAPKAIARILTELVSNSISHGLSAKCEGIIRLAVSAEVGGGAFVLRYSDNGEGIAPNDLSRVFEPFFRVGRKDGGAGLGLSLVQTLVVEKLNGRIQLAVHPAGGTGLTISIPARVVSSGRKRK